MRYLDERLAENKPPAKYDPRTAHLTFDFIDPTWAPGVSSGLLENGVHEGDANSVQDDIGSGMPTEEVASHPEVSDSVSS
jgi:hypothetical protein